MPNPARILIVDDHPLVRTGLAKLVGDELDFEVCGEADDAAEALEQIRVLEPDLALVDLILPGRSGLDLIKDIRARWPDLPVVAISGQEESVYGERALRAGARGFVTKLQANTEVVRTIRRVLGGEVVATERVTSRLLNRLAEGTNGDTSPVASLTDRELEVFNLLGAGFATREIAERLHLSIKTIETYRTRVKKKLGLNNSSELIKHAVEWSSQLERTPILGPDPHGRPPPPALAEGERYWLVSHTLSRPLALGAAERYVIGRQGSDIEIASSQVSRRHAEFRCSGEGVQLVDLDSTNGTLLNGHLLQSPCWIYPGDRVHVAGFEISVAAGHRPPRTDSETWSSRRDK